MRTRAIMFALLVLAAEWLASVACWAKPLPQEIAAESEGSSSSSSKEQPGKSREAERIKKDADSEFMVNRPPAALGCGLAAACRRPDRRIPYYGQRLQQNAVAKSHHHQSLQNTVHCGRSGPGGRRRKHVVTGTCSTR